MKNGTYISINKAAHRVPPTTLEHRLSGRAVLGTAPKQYLSTEEETELADHQVEIVYILTFFCISNLMYCI